MLIASPLAAQNLNIDLGSTFGTPGSSYGAAAAQPGTWTTIGLGATSNLAGLNGSPTPVDASVVADTDLGSLGDCTGDLRALTGDNIYSENGASWTVTLTSLQNGEYTVYLYAPDNTAVPLGETTVNGSPVASVTGDSCTLTDGVTHAITTVTIDDGTLTMTASVPGNYAGIAGLQLIREDPAQAALPAEVPLSPAALALLAMVLAGTAVFVLRQV